MSKSVGVLREDALGRGQVFWFNKPEDNTYLYTHSLRELTDEEITSLFRASSDHIEFARAILKKASEK